MNVPAERLDEQANLARGMGVPFLMSFLLLLLTTGCARFARRQSLPPPSAAILGPSALTNPGLKRFIEQQLRKPLDQWPLQKWDFAKLTLAACYFSPRFNAAQSQWQQAEAALAAARGTSQPFVPAAPSLPSERLAVPSASVASGAGATRPNEALSAPAPTSTASPADHSSKHAQNFVRAEHQADFARLRRHAVAWQVRASVRTNLIDYVAAQHAEVLLKDLESTYVQLGELGEAPSETTFLPPLDLSLLRLQLAQTRLALIQTMLKRMNTRARLADSLALPLDVLLGVEVEFDFLRRPALGLIGSDLRWQALHNRPDLLEALADCTEADGALRTEISKRRPRAPLAPDCKWDQRKCRWMVNPEYGLPTGVRWGRSALRAEARRMGAATRLLNLQADIIDEVERSNAVYRTAAEEAPEIDTLVAALVRQYKVVRGRFEAGKAEAAELSLARAQFVTAGISKLEAQVKLQHALGSLEDALQQPVELIGPADPF